MFKYCYYTGDKLDYLNFKSHISEGDQFQLDSIDSLIDWICDDVMYNYIEDADNLGIEYNNKRIVIEHFKTTYKEYFPETWEEYCTRVNAKFYLDDYGIEDTNDYAERYDEQEETKAKKLYSLLKQTIMKELSLQDNAKIYKLTTDRGYSHFNTINIINTITNEKEAINLSLDFYVENARIQRVMSGFWYPTYIDASFKIHNYRTEEVFCVKEGDLFTEAEIKDIRNKFEFIFAPVSFLESTDYYIVDIEKIGKGVRFYLGTKEQFENAWGDDFNDCPYNCKAGIVYNKYVSFTYDWMPNNFITVETIEDYLMNSSNNYICKSMFLRRILPPIVVIDTLKSYDVTRKNEYPIFLGDSCADLKKKLEQIENKKY